MQPTTGRARGPSRGSGAVCTRAADGFDQFMHDARRDSLRNYRRAGASSGRGLLRARVWSLVGACHTFVYDVYTVASETDGELVLVVLCVVLAYVLLLSRVPRVGVGAVCVCVCVCVPREVRVWFFE